MSFKGILIAIEGIDGTGKTTQVAALAARFEAAGFSVLTTKEPTQGPWGQKLRASATTGRLPPEEELHAFVEDRKEHCQSKLIPALEAGKVVIVDRYYFSTAAYQGARGMSVDSILAQNEVFAPQPDALFVLDADVDLALARVRDRDGEGNLFERREDLDICRRLFKSIERPYKVEVDGTLSVEGVTAAIVAALTSGHLYEKQLFRSLCWKDYKSECEPAFCSYRISNVCQWARLGALSPEVRRLPMVAE